MTNNYQFLDAYGSVKTAAAIDVAGALQPVINIAGSVVTVGGTASANQSVSGTVNIVDSSIATLQGTNPWHVTGSVAAAQYGLAPGTYRTSIVSTVPASVSGVGIFNTTNIGNGSIITVWKDSSVLAGLVSTNASVVGTYAEDSAHTTGDKGVFTLAVRNDTVSSFVSADTEYAPRAVDSAGRTITKPFAATEALVQGVGSTVNIGKASLLGLSGTGLRNYVTDILVANTGSVATFVTFTDSDASIIGRTIAPATSGSNIHLATPMRTGSLNSQVEFAAITAVSILSVSAYGYKAP